MAHRLVIGIDGSTESAGALRWAVAEADRCDRELHLVHALTLPTTAEAFGATITAPEVADFERYAMDLLTAAEQQARDWGSQATISKAVEFGSPTAVLLREAADAAGLVIGTRGLGALSSAMLGSVSGRLASRAHCPVYVIPSDADGAATADSAGPVVVGVDGSPESDAAVRLGLALAESRNTTLRAVSAFHVPALAMPIEQELIDEFNESERAEAQSTIEGALARAGAPEHPVEVEVTVVQGMPAEVILSASHDASIIVIGSRGHGAFLRLVLGSVSRAVLQQAGRPVAVVTEEMAFPSAESAD